MQFFSPYSLLLVNLVLSALLCGLIWTVQLVHYPAFLHVGPKEYRLFQQKHMRNISLLVIPLMVAELAFALLLLWQQYAANIRGTAYLLSAPILIIWLSTLFISSPIHERLYQNGYKSEEIKKLVRTNWIRTICWSLRTLLLFLLLLNHEVNT